MKPQPIITCNTSDSNPAAAHSQSRQQEEETIKSKSKPSSSQGFTTRYGRGSVPPDRYSPGSWRY